jgi:hypothetical protein
MKVKFLTTVAVLLFTRCASAQNPSCRQSWMPTDAPAFCAWQPEPSLPEARTYHTVVLADDNIYVLVVFDSTRRPARLSITTAWHDRRLEPTAILARGRLVQLHESSRVEQSFKRLQVAPELTSRFLTGPRSPTARGKMFPLLAVEFAVDGGMSAVSSSSYKRSSSLTVRSNV